MFAISHSPINVTELVSSLHNPRAGALVVFEGRVRDHNDDRNVVNLEYEAFDELATSEGSKILQDVISQFEVLAAKCVHRVGRLEIGDLAVWTGVISEHRMEAFRACEQIIEQVKLRVPIWKKEYYTNGQSGWVNCQEPIKQNG